MRPAACGLLGDDEAGPECPGSCNPFSWSHRSWKEERKAAEESAASAPALDDGGKQFFERFQIWQTEKLVEMKSEARDMMRKEMKKDAEATPAFAGNTSRTMTRSKGEEAGDDEKEDLKTDDIVEDAYATIKEVTETKT